MEILALQLLTLIEVEEDGAMNVILVKLLNLQEAYENAYNALTHHQRIV